MKSLGFKTLAVGAVALMLAGCSAPTGVNQFIQQADGPLTTATGVVARMHAAYSQDAIEQVIRHANDEQQQAFAQNNPTLMQDTATSDYYNQLAQLNAQMHANGVQSIHLVNLRWGSVTVNGSTSQATTSETWRTTFADGTIDVGTDQNVYSLVNDNGAWKVQSDDQPRGSGGASPATQPSQPAPISTAPNDHRSANWSGYEATGGKFTSITGTWTVPQASGDTPGADAAWVGIGGVDTHDLIQAGTQETTTGAGHVEYQAWIETLPHVSHNVPLTVSPGDSVTVTLAEQSPGQWQIAMKDNTSGQAYNTTRQYASSESSAEWVEEAPSSLRSVVPLDNFGAINFSGASATENGKTVNVSQASGQAITMINGAGQALASPSALGNDGSSFSVTRTPASSSLPGGTRVRLRPQPLPFPIGIGF
ncbi:MAG: G1 family glutamic endopeptidase [Chloroflexota bacterium]